jgi:LPS O-antigen subunit length determinant protein (WzzB/FepE family)
MAQINEPTNLWTRPRVVALGVIILLVMAFLFVALAGSRLSRRYHKGTATVRATESEMVGGTVMNQQM